MGGAVHNIGLVVACFEFDFMGGSMGSVVGEQCCHYTTSTCPLLNMALRANSTKSKIVIPPELLSLVGVKFQTIFSHTFSGVVWAADSAKNGMTCEQCPQGEGSTVCLRRC